jgi:hypothetical protein
MQAVGLAARKAQRVSVQKAALAMKDAHTAQLMRDTSGGRLRNVGKKGTKLSVRYKLHGNDANPSATVEAVGSWPILNNPTKPHEIRPRRGRAIRVGDGFRRSAHHPGTKGKQTWQKAKPKAAKDATAELNKTMTRAVQEAYKG